VPQSFERRVTLRFGSRVGSLSGVHLREHALDGLEASTLPPPADVIEEDRDGAIASLRLEKTQCSNDVRRRAAMPPCSGHAVDRGRPARGDSPGRCRHDWRLPLVNGGAPGLGICQAQHVPFRRTHRCRAPERCVTLDGRRAGAGAAVAQGQHCGQAPLPHDADPMAPAFQVGGVRDQTPRCRTDRTVDEQTPRSTFAVVPRGRPTTFRRAILPLFGNGPLRRHSPPSYDRPWSSPRLYGETLGSIVNGVD
jgi:hypothetical protein